VTALSHLAANGDEAAYTQYDAVIIGLSRPTKEVARELAELISALGEQTAKLIVFSPNAETLRGLEKRVDGLRDSRHAESIGQLTGLLDEMLPTARERSAEDPAPPWSAAADIAGAKVLIVDDDIRNIYSLTSVLETYGVEVLHAERGRDGIALLEQYPDIDAALIDIMMPEMDGYETIREIRRQPRLADLAIISVTAKAMKGDRQKCLDAGASDYIAKPVDLELLMALLRVWIGRARERPHTEDLLLAAK